jgi:hypothetical protein
MYEVGFRLAALKLYEAVKSFRKVSRILGCSIGILSKWLWEGCTMKAGRVARRKRLLHTSMLNQIEEYVNSKPFCSKKDIQRSSGIGTCAVSSAEKLTPFGCRSLKNTTLHDIIVTNKSWESLWIRGYFSGGSGISSSKSVNHFCQ